MADGNGSNRFSEAPGQSRWIVESGPGDTCLNAMAVISTVAQALLAIPRGPSPLDEEQAEGMFRMLMSARDAISTVYGHLDRKEMGAANG